MHKPKFFAALFAFASACVLSPQASAQPSQPHAEHCTTWGYMRDANYAYGAVNMCERPVHIWFMQRGSDVIDARVDANTVFATNIALGERRPNWAAATCYEGYEPNVPVDAQNWGAILSSQYRCVRRRR